MRYLLVVSALLFAAPAWSQIAKVPSDVAPAQQPVVSVQKVEITQSADKPLKVEQVEDDHAKLRAEEDLKAQKDQAKYAKYLFWLTLLTGMVIVVQLFFNGLATRASLAAAQSAKLSADAASVAAMPYLIPVVSRVSQVPENAKNIHRPFVRMAFKNVGSSPAVLKTIRAKVYIVENDRYEDSVPTNSDALPFIHRSDAVPPGVIKGVKVWQHDRDVGEHINNGLRADPYDPDGYMRIYVLGQVVYEDILSVEYKKTFLIKILSATGCRAIGGKAYNDLTKRPQTNSEDMI